MSVLTTTTLIKIPLHSFISLTDWEQIRKIHDLWSTKCIKVGVEMVKSHKASADVNTN